MDVRARTRAPALEINDDGWRRRTQRRALVDQGVLYAGFVVGGRWTATGAWDAPRAPWLPTALRFAPVPRREEQ